MDIGLFTITVLTALAGLVGWFLKYRKRVKTRPFLLVTYHRQVSSDKNDSMIVSFENTGDGPVRYFTASITSKNGNFTIEQIHGPVKPSGMGGSWTVISGNDLLPQQRAIVNISFSDAGVTLDAPAIKSDSPYKFAGEVRMKVGPFVSVSDGGYVPVTSTPPILSSP